MNKKLCLIFTAFVVCITIFACTNINDKKVDANIGDGKVMNLVFDANPTTGFSWEYLFAEGNDKGELKAIKEEYVSSNTDKNLVGAGGKMYYSFEATKPGKQSIRFVYRRPWEGGESAYDVVYELDIDKDLKIACLSKMKGSIDSEKELSSFPDPTFSD